MVPTLLNFLVAHPHCNSKTMSHLSTAIVGAAPVSPAVAYALKEKLDKPILFQESNVYLLFLYLFI